MLRVVGQRRQVLPRRARRPARPGLRAASRWYRRHLGTRPARLSAPNHALPQHVRYTDRASPSDLPIHAVWRSPRMTTAHARNRSTSSPPAHELGWPTTCLACTLTIRPAPDAATKAPGSGPANCRPPCTRVGSRGSAFLANTVASVSTSPIRTRSTPKAPTTRCRSSSTCPPSRSVARACSTPAPKRRNITTSRRRCAVRKCSSSCSRSPAGARIWPG